MKQVSSFSAAKASDGAKAVDRGLDDGMSPATPEMRRRGLFGRKVRLLRERLAMSPSEFAERYGFVPADVADWERGRIMPDAGIVERIETLDADPDAAPSRVPGP